MRTLHCERVVLGLVLAAAALAAAGCHPGPFIGLMIDPFRPPPTKEALYPLAEKIGKAKLVVWVHDVPEEREARHVDLRGMLSRKLGHKLKRDVKVEAISYGKVAQLFWDHPGIGQAPPAKIGKLVGADKVLFVDVRRFAVRDTADSSIYRGRMLVHVAVIDVASGDQDWPVALEGHSINLDTDTREPERRDLAPVIGGELIDKAATAIANVFHTHEIKDEPDETP
jgi:hypothetical protein